MKKFARLIALTLVCALLMSLATIAHADTCYELIKMVYEDETDDTFVYLGEGMNFDADVDSDLVYFIASVPSGYVGVTGLNANSKAEGYAWIDVSEGNALLAFTEFCMAYETLCEYLDECEQLVGGIYLTEDGDPIIVSDASDAANFVSAIEEWLEEE